MGLPSSVGHDRIGSSLQEKRIAAQKQAVLIISALIAVAFLFLIPLLWTEFSTLFEHAKEEYVLKRAMDDLARQIFIKVGGWFVVTLVVEIAAIIWLVRTSGVECAHCHKSLLSPGRWDQAETQGTCPCCRAPIENLFKTGAHDVAKDRAERLRILKRNHALFAIALVGWSITLALSLVGLVMRVDWALILVCANGAALLANVIVVQFTRRQIRRLADAGGAASLVK